MERDKRIIRSSLNYLLRKVSGSVGVLTWNNLVPENTLIETELPVCGSLLNYVCVKSAWYKNVEHRIETNPEKVNTHDHYKENPTHTKCGKKTNWGHEG